MTGKFAFLAEALKHAQVDLDVYILTATIACPGRNSCGHGRACPPGSKEITWVSGIGSLFDAKKINQGPQISHPLGRDKSLV